MPPQPALPLVSIGPLVVAFIALAGGLGALMVYSRRRETADLDFGLCCLGVAVFDMACALANAASSPAQALPMYQLQWAALAPAFFFFMRYGRRRLSLPVSRAAETAFGVFMALMALLQLANPLGLAWDAASANVRQLTLPLLGWGLAFPEFNPGPVVALQSAAGFGMGGWLVWLALRRGPERDNRTFTFVAAVGILALAGLVDMASLAWRLPLPYFFDYSFAGVLLLMGLATARNLAEGALARQSLRTAEERFRHLEATSEEVFWEVNLHGALRYVSPKVGALTGWAPADVLGAKPWEFLGDETRQQEAQAAWDRLAAGGGEVIAMEVRLRRRNGGPLTLEISGYPFSDDTGALRGWRGIARDVTLRRAMETEGQRVRQRKGLAALARSLGHDFGKLADLAAQHASKAADQLPEGDSARIEAEKAVVMARRITELSVKMDELFPK